MWCLFRTTNLSVVAFVLCGGCETSRLLLLASQGSICRSLLWLGTAVCLLRSHGRCRDCLYWYHSIESSPGELVQGRCQNRVLGRCRSMSQSRSPIPVQCQRCIQIHIGVVRVVPFWREVLESQCRLVGVWVSSAAGSTTHQVYVAKSPWPGTRATCSVGIS